MVLSNITAPINTMNKKLKKTTKGRKKIEIKKIEETSSRQVTFSKRRTGFFKKASELCVLTGAEVAVLVNCPGGRVFAFGHPNIDHLLNRYFNTNPVEKNLTHYADRFNEKLTREFNEHYMEVCKELEAEKKRGEMVPASGSGMAWFDEEIDGLPVEELEKYLWSLVELKKKVVTRADELMMINKSPGLLGGGLSDGWFSGGGFPASGSVRGGGFYAGETGLDK